MPDAGDEAAQMTAMEILTDLKELGRAVWRAGMSDVRLPEGRARAASERQRGRSVDGCPDPSASGGVPERDADDLERVVRREVGNDGEARQLSSALRGAGVPFVSYERPGGGRAFVMREPDLAEGWRRVGGAASAPVTDRQMAFIASLERKGPSPVARSRPSDRPRRSRTRTGCSTSMSTRGTGWTSGKGGRFA